LSDSGLLIENVAVCGMFVASGRRAIAELLDLGISPISCFARFGVRNKLGFPEFQSICKGRGGNPEIFTMRNL
jgi:hypothetical protein